MESHLLIILIIITIGILIADFFQWRYLRKLLTKKTNDNQLSDERYIELKISTLTLKSTIIMVSVVIVFLGWNVRSNITTEIKGEITPEIGTLLPIYVVPDLSIKSKEPLNTFHFKDMKPINAQRLPVFEEPPIINIEQTGRTRTVYINEITKSYVNLN